MNEYYDWTSDIYDVFDDSGEQDITWTQDKQSMISYQAAEQIVKENGLGYYSDPDDAIFEEQADIIGLYAIPKDSTLYDLLIEWYGDEQTLKANVRNYTEDEQYIYFVTGVGYDILSNDLLGGSANGQARKEFDIFVDEQMKQQY